MAADCRDDKDIGKQFRRQNAVGNMLVRKSSFAPIYGDKNSIVQVILLHNLWMTLFDVIQIQTLLKNLLSVLVTHSNDLLMSPDTPARVWQVNGTDHIDVVLHKST